MAKDITIRVTGQNPDGSLNVQQLDGGNPFAAQPQSTAMVPYNASAAAMQNAPANGYRAKINGVDVTFATEADYLKADRALRDMVESQNLPAVGGLGGARGSGGINNWLRTGANAADAVAGFLNGRNVRRKLEELEAALEDSREARTELDNLERTNTTLAPLIPTLRKLFLAERDATETSVSVLEDQLTAVDIQTGSGVANVAADIMGPSTPGGNSGEGGGLGTAVALGGAGLGLGLLLTNSRDSERSRRRRR